MFSNRCNLCYSPARVFPGSATFLASLLFVGVPRFFLDVVDDTQVTEDPDGLEFTDLNTAIAEAAQGARDIVAHSIMKNEDVSGQEFRIRDATGQTVATVPFRDCLPGRLRG